MSSPKVVPASKLVLEKSVARVLRTKSGVKTGYLYTQNCTAPVPHLSATCGHSAGTSGLGD